MTPETAIKKQIKDYLNHMKWFNFHVLQGLGSYKGVPDLIACKDGVTLFIEVKTEKGRQSEYQKSFEECVKESGCHYIIAHSWLDVSNYISQLN